MSSFLFEFHNSAHNRPFTMRVVADGENYGKDMKLVHSVERPQGELVEFYDKGWDFDKDPDGKVLGQFVSRYYLETLLERSKDGKTAFDAGLMLDAGIGWRISASGMRMCFNALEEAGLIPDQEARDALAGEDPHDGLTL